MKKCAGWGCVISWILCTVCFAGMAGHVAEPGPDGMLTEPFWLVPAGYLFLFMAVIAHVVYVIASKRSAR